MNKLNIDTTDKKGGKKQVRFHWWIYGTIGVLILLVIGLGVLLKECTALKEVTSLNKFAKKKEYQIPKEKGLIRKTEILMDTLLSMANKEGSLSHIDSINALYPALEFALPYEWRQEAYKEDIRLVGIKPEFLKNAELKKFYYNSRLPKLLEEQRKNLDKKIFDIDFRQDGIKSIKLIPSMFKVPLTHDPWTGKITSKPCELFPDSDYVFLICENSVLPVKKLSKVKDVVAGKKFTILTSGLEVPAIKSEGKRVDFYEYYQQVKGKELPTQFDLGENEWFRIMYAQGDTLWVRSSDNVEVRIFDSKSTPRVLKNSDAAKNAHYTWEKLEGNTKLLITRKEKGRWKKHCEVQVVMSNPLTDLSYLIHTNHGRERVIVDSVFTDVYTQQVLRVLQQQIHSDAPQEIALTIDPVFSRSMQKELESYLDDNLKGFLQDDKENIEISMTVINSATGEVLALPFASSLKVPEGFVYNRKNPNLIRRYIGSTFKPLMTLAAVLTYPDLLNFNLDGKVSYASKPDSANLSGFPIANPFARRHWREKINVRDRKKDKLESVNLQNYLAISDDVYPVALAVYALNDYADNHQLISKRKKIVEGHRSFEILNNNTFFAYGKNNKRNDAKDLMFPKVLDELYQVYSNIEDYQNTTLSRLPAHYLWRFLWNVNDSTEKSLTLSEISPEGTNMHYNTWKQGSSIKGELAPWVLGQGSNEWSILKQAEAWARMVTKRPVFATLVVPDSLQSIGWLPDSIYHNQFNRKEQDGFISDSKKIDETWNQFLDQFLSAQSKDTNANTLSGFYELVKSLKLDLICLSKTGTPDEFPRKEYYTIKGDTLNYDIGMFATSIMTQEQFKGIKNNTPLQNAGITCIVRIVHTYPAYRHHRTGKKASYNIWSSDAIDFYTKKRLQKIYDFTGSCFNK